MIRGIRLSCPSPAKRGNIAPWGYTKNKASFHQIELKNLFIPKINNNTVSAKSSVKKKTKITEEKRVYEAIKKAILKGLFLPGERLIEDEVAREFKTSRPTVRSSLSVLEKEGLVESESYRGSRVARIALEEALEILDARALLESHIAGLAVEKITDRELGDMGSIVQQMKTATSRGDYERYSELNTEFHAIIYEASRNNALRDLLLQLKMRMVRYQFRISYIPGRMEKSIGEHTGIYNALKQRDASKVKELIKTHVLSVKSTVQANFKLLEA